MNERMREDLNGSATRQLTITTTREAADTRCAVAAVAAAINYKTHNQRINGNACN